MLPLQPTYSEGFSLQALHNRMSAVWFKGRGVNVQRQCLIMFAVIYLIKNRILDDTVPVSWLAYVLATTFHETAGTMQPIAEYGLGRGRPYGEPDIVTRQTYYGRGYAQLTGKDNYQKAEDVVVELATLEHNVPLVKQPDLAMNPVYAVQIAISGMVQGWFTGKKLGDYLTDPVPDYVNARRIINGTDQAEQIAEYAREAEQAIRLAQGETIALSLVRKGSRGDDVRELQLALGEMTEVALYCFQRAHGLKQDGICGPETWLMIDRVIYGL